MVVTAPYKLRHLFECVAVLGKAGSYRTLRTDENVRAPLWCSGLWIEKDGVAVSIRMSVIVRTMKQRNASTRVVGYNRAYPTVSVGTWVISLDVGPLPGRPRSVRHSPTTHSSPSQYLLHPEPSRAGNELQNLLGHLLRGIS
jgi:hypothetical protein